MPLDVFIIMFFLIKKVPEFSLAKKKFNFLTVGTFIILTAFKMFVIMSWDFRTSYVRDNRLLGLLTKNEYLVSSLVYTNLTYFYPLFMPYELIVTKLRSKNPEVFFEMKIDAEIAEYKSRCEKNYEQNPYSTYCDELYSELMVNPKYKDLWFDKYFKKMIDLSIFQMKKKKFDDSGYISAIENALKYGKISQEEFQNYLYDGCLKYNSGRACDDGFGFSVDFKSEEFAYKMFVRTCVLSFRCFKHRFKAKWNLLGCVYEKNKKYPCYEDDYKYNLGVLIPGKVFSNYEAFFNKVYKKDITKFLKDIEEAKKEVVNSEYGLLREQL
ncbi:MAG: hypothetical protein Fur0010_03140 [Bdellovibrio sp.]